MYYNNFMNLKSLQEKIKSRQSIPVPMDEFSKKVKEALVVNTENPEYERRLENFVSAAYDAGFDVDYFGAWESGRKDEYGAIWNAYKKELCRALKI